MYHHTKIIILNTIKYGESGLIVKGYSRDFGLVSYFIKSISKSKKGKFKKAFFQPLSQLSLVAKHSDKGQLNYIKDIEIAYHYQELYTDIIKQNIGLFLAELLVNTLEEHQSDKELFDRLEMRLQQLDTLSHPANFHLAFIKEFINLMGVTPNLPLLQPSKAGMEYPKPYFDLIEGHYSSIPSGPVWLEGEKLHFFENVMTNTFEDILKQPLKRSERQMILQILLQYLELHLPKFKRPKSLDILTEVF